MARLLLTHRRRRIALAATAGALALAAVTPGVAMADSSTSASPDAPVPVPEPTHYWATSISTTSNYANKAHILARCSNAGGTCSIHSESSYSTEIGVSLGATAADLSPALSFNRSDSNSTGVTCNSPRALKSGEVYEAFALGIYKSYVVEELRGGVPGTGSGAVVSTSGRTHGFDPYTAPSIDCEIVG